MEQRNSFYILIFDWENDTFVLEYDKRIEGWKLQHESNTTVCSYMWYESANTLTQHYMSV